MIPSPIYSIVRQRVFESYLLIWQVDSVGIPLCEGCRERCHREIRGRGKASSNALRPRESRQYQSFISGISDICWMTTNGKQHRPTKLCRFAPPSLGGGAKRQSFFVRHENNLSRRSRSSFCQVSTLSADTLEIFCEVHSTTCKYHLRGPLTIPY